MCKPLLYWHIYYILENDLTRATPERSAQQSFAVRIYQGEKDLRDIASQLSSLGELTLEDIYLRARRGDLVGVAYAGTELVGYSWMSRSDELRLAFDVTWIMHANEAVLYGSFVPRQWRGKGIHISLDIALNRFAREQGIVRTIGSMAVSNRQTLALARRTNKRRVMTVALARVRGIEHTWKIALGASFSSRFRVHGT